MTFRRRIVKNGHTYLYEVRSYREKGRVKQAVNYLGTEIEREGKMEILPPRYRRGIRSVLDSSAYIMFRTAEDYGFTAEYEDALNGLTSIPQAAMKIVMLAAECMVGREHSIHVHTGIPELREKEIRDVVELVGRKDPDVVATLERSMAPSLIRKYGSSGIVYDLSAIRYFGTENDLARYGHYYHVNGENREINFALAVTRKGGIPIHNRPLAGNIPSVSSIRSFSLELKDYGILTILIVMDRGFYSDENIKDLSNYTVIGALPSTVTLHDDLTAESEGMDSSRNYFQHNGETIFVREKSVRGIRYVVYFSPRLRSSKLESFYSRLSEMEGSLNILKEKKFDSPMDMMRTVGEQIKGFGNLIDVAYDRDAITFSYELKHKAIQRRTNKFGYSILFTNSSIRAQDILRIYREKDTVEKAFSHLKPHLEPFFSRSESGTRARLFLTVLGYTLVAIIADRCGITYNQALKTISGIREVVYSDGSHSHAEYTKEQRELMEKLKIVL